MSLNMQNKETRKLHESGESEMKREKKEVKNKENRNMKTPRKDEKRRLHLRGAKSKRIKETRK